VNGKAFSLIFCCHLLVGASLSCSDNGELFGARTTAEAGVGAAPAKAGAGAGMAGDKTSSGGTASAGGSDAETGGTVGSGGQETAGNGSGGLLTGSAGSAGAANGGAGGTGDSPMCPTGCEPTPLGSCSSGEQLWECGAAYEHQEMVDAGCRDLATGIQRFCCPVEAYPGCAVACAEVTSQAECDARADCHAVFVDPHNCACAAIGCCARFSRCADGAQANCDTSNLACTVPSPYCESPAYVVSTAASCYEGCVKPEDCAP
jgi:hypothetical protein